MDSGRGLNPHPETLRATDLYVSPICPLFRYSVPDIVIHLLDDLAGAATDWQKIAAGLPGRSNKDCRKRWFNVLSGGLRKGAWSPEEDSYLRDAVRIEGKS